MKPEAQRLIDTTRECLELALAQCVPGKRLSDIGRAVQAHAEARGYSLVRDYAGHGIGTKMHEDPQVPNYVDAATLKHAAKKKGMRALRDDGADKVVAGVTTAEELTRVTQEDSMSLEAFS